MDAEIEVARAEGFTVARVTKQRDADEGGMHCFRLVPVALFGARPDSSAAVEHIGKPPRERKARTSDAQSLAVNQMRAMSRDYPEGVQLEVLAIAINRTRPDIRLDSIKRSISRIIDSGQLTIDSAGLVRLPTDISTGVPPIATDTTANLHR
jgi:hypothetical protein